MAIVFNSLIALTALGLTGWMLILLVWDEIFGAIHEVYDPLGEKKL